MKKKINFIGLQNGDLQLEEIQQVAQLITGKPSSGLPSVLEAFQVLDTTIESLFITFQKRISVSI